jgi:branched-subunit amino acid transport protein
MSPATVTLIGLAAGSYVLKALGPMVLGGGRALPARLQRAVVVAPAALLAAIVVTSTLADGRSLTVDARLGGVVAAGVLAARRAPLGLIVAVAAAVTALARLAA